MPSTSGLAIGLPVRALDNAPRDRQHREANSAAKPAPAPMASVDPAAYRSPSSTVPRIPPKAAATGAPAASKPPNAKSGSVRFAVPPALYRRHSSPRTGCYVRSHNSNSVARRSGGHGTGGHFPPYRASHRIIWSDSQRNQRANHRRQQQTTRQQTTSAPAFRRKGGENRPIKPIIPTAFTNNALITIASVNAPDAPARAPVRGYAPRHHPAPSA